MTTLQKRAHERLLQTLPVRTHLREEHKQNGIRTDRYSGREVKESWARNADHLNKNRVNTWIARAPK